MKKSLKMFFSLLATLTLTLGIALPVVSAQDTNWDEVLTQINEVNQDIVSMEGNGKISLAADEFMNADVNLDFRFNTEERFALELTGDVTGELISTDAEGNPSTMPLDFAGEVAIVEGIAYLFDGTSWTVEDISEQEEEIASQIESAMAQVQSQAEAVNDPELTKKYFDLSETDTEYVITLKQDINPDEFWADVESHVDLETIKQESFDQAIEQAEAAGEELTEEDRQELQEQLDQSFEAGKSIAFKLIDTLEMRYSKETYYLTHMLMTYSLEKADLEELAAELGESTEALPEDFNVNFSLEFNFTNHGQVFDITVPEGAPTFNGETTDDASTEEESSVAEDGATEESAPAEETGAEEEDSATEEETTEEIPEDSTEEPAEEGTSEDAAE